ncbi:MAG: acyl-CoA synthetase [Desulfobacterales bacterium]|nr:acyl-CoA synthetase [Desulfobacterales bacterium]
MAQIEHPKRELIPLPDIDIVIPEYTNIAWEACDKHVAEGRGDRVLFYFEDQKVTFRQLQIQVNRIGNALKRSGIKPGETVVIRSPNCPQLYAAVLAVMKIGAVAVPSQTLYKEREIEYVVNNSDAVLVFAHPDVVGPVDAIRNNCPSLRHIVVFGPSGKDHIGLDDFVKDCSASLEGVRTRNDDPAYILYTSGTSGTPKGVVRMHRDTFAGGIPTSRQIALCADDIFLHPFELSFGFVFATMSAIIYSGCRFVMYTGRTQVERILEFVEKYRVTKLGGAPSMFRMMLGIEGLESRFDLSSLKCFLSGGEVLPAETYRELKERLGIETLDGFGQTEGCAFVNQRPTFPVRHGSMGKPYPGIPMAVFDENGKYCPPNTTGYLVARADSPNLFKEYKKMPEKWDEVHRYPGWYATGDMAYFDDDGYYYWVGRADAMIKSRGYLVSPKEVEETVLEMPEVLEVAAVGSPDPVMGNRVKVFITLRSGAQSSSELAEKVREHTRNRIAPYKVPKDIEFVPDLPKTNTGKLFRRPLQELEQDRYEKGETSGFRFQ